MSSKKAVRPGRPKLVADTVSPSVDALPGDNPFQFLSLGVLLSEDMEFDAGAVAGLEVSFGLDELGTLYLRGKRDYYDATVTQSRPMFEIEIDFGDEEIDLWVGLLRQALDTYPRLRALRQQLKAEGAVVPARVA